MPDSAPRSIISRAMVSRESRIVVGYDGSGTARAAVDQAARRTGSHGKLVVVYVCGPRPLGMHEAGELELRQAVLEVLLIQAGDALHEVAFELLCVPGSPARVLAAIAEEQDASEIVVGGGEVAHELGEATDRPVVVVTSNPPRKAAEDSR
jgi:Universal stress protein family